MDLKSDKYRTDQLYFGSLRSNFSHRRQRKSILSGGREENKFKLRIGFDDSGFRKLNFKQYGIMEEGLALIFARKQVTEKSIRRIKQLVYDFELSLQRYGNNPKDPASLERAEHCMKHLCAKIGQFETVISDPERFSSDAVSIAYKALGLISEYAPDTYSKHASNRLESYPSPDTELLVGYPI